MTTNVVPTVADAAAHRIGAVNPPPVALCSAPPMGGPVNAANDIVAKHIPSHVPNLLISGQMLATVDGMMH